MRSAATAASHAPGSNARCRMMVPPRSSVGVISMPAACEIGAHAR